MAEAMLRHMAGDRFEVMSAGSHPAGFVHELAVTAMDRMGIAMKGQRSKGWDEYENTPLDLVITVCDAAASVPCPTWPGNAMKAHWPLPDPACYAGEADERIEFALQVAKRLQTKLEKLVDMDFSQDRAQLQQHLDFLGDI
jgi:arsenate reductase